MGPPVDAFLAAVIASSEDAILTEAPDGTITSWNPGAERLYGFRASEAIGRRVSFHVPSHRRGEEDRILEAVLSGQRVDHYETERQTKGGAVVPVSLTVSPIRDVDGDVIGASAIARDTTERRRADRMAAIGQMTAEIGHELRNQLASVMNVLFIIRRSLNGPKGQGIERHLAVAERQTERAAQLAIQITEFIRHRDPEITARPFDEVVLDVLEAHPPPDDVEVFVEGKEVSVRADAAQLVQILGNLVTNAYQAMPDGGRIRLVASTEGNATVLSLEDQGVGIDPELLDRLFEPFVSTKSEGSGLGLAIVRRLVETHGGVVTLENRDGGGTRATVRLPRGVSAD